MKSFIQSSKESLRGRIYRYHMVLNMIGGLGAGSSISRLLLDYRLVYWVSLILSLGLCGLSYLALKLHYQWLRTILIPPEVRSKRFAH